jgi:transposase
MTALPASPGNPAAVGDIVDTIHPHCAGIDVHKDSVVVCVRHWNNGQVQQEVQTYGTRTRQLLALGDWLVAEGVTHAAMESTGVYWKPVWNLLEGRGIELILVNAQHVKHLPGRKSDVLDCQWLGELDQHGLLRPSFVPSQAQRDLRDLTRQRSQLIAEKARVANRIQKTLEDANIKLGSVASDVLGVSGRDMLRSIIAGNLSPEAMADLARRRMREKIPQLREALTGHVRDHHRFLLRTLMDHLEYLEKQVEQFDERIEQIMSPLEQEAVKRLDTIPGVDVRAAQNILAEIGTDMSRFPTSHHLCSWAGMVPGTHQSGPNRRQSRLKAGNRWLKAILNQCGWAASRTKNTYLSSLYHRLAGRKGKKRAVMAVGHSQLQAAYFILYGGVDYQDLGPEHLNKVRTKQQTRYLVRRLHELGYDVTLTPAA